MKENKKQIFKFCIIGTLNAAITYITLFMLSELCVNELLANFIGYILVLINSFLWSRFWIFKSKNKNIFKEIVLFVSAFLLAYILQFTSFSILVRIFNVNQYLANLIGLVVFGATNFIANKKITFNI